MVNIFTCRCPNRSGVGAIDSLDLFEQVLDQRFIHEENLYESREKNLQVVWKNEGHTSSAQLP